MQCTRDLVGNRNASSRKREDDNVVAVPVVVEKAGKDATCLSPVPEDPPRFRRRG